MYFRITGKVFGVDCVSGLKVFGVDCVNGLNFIFKRRDSVMEDFITRTEFGNFFRSPLLIF